MLDTHYRRRKDERAVSGDMDLVRDHCHHSAIRYHTTNERGRLNMGRQGKPLSEVELLLTHDIIKRDDYLGLVTVQRIDGVVGTFEVFKDGGRTWYTDWAEDE